MKETYERNRYKKWCVLSLGIMIGLVIGISIPQIYTFLTSAFYDRKHLDDFLTKYLGQTKLTQSIASEYLATAYEYST